jgi:hypothetical protein
MEYDARQAAASLASGRLHRTGRKLNIYHQCSILAAHYSGIPPKVIADAYQITPATVSLIGGCLHDSNPTELVYDDDDVATGETQPRDMNTQRSPNRKRRYPKVAEEFERLGETEFFKRYFGKNVHDRLFRATYGTEPDPD